MSIRKNESLVKFIAPSKTSGAMYLRVPTCEKQNSYLRVIIKNMKNDIYIYICITCPCVSPQGFPG